MSENNIMQEIEAQVRLRQMAEARYASNLRRLGCPEECVETFLSDRRQMNAEMQEMAGHQCCGKRDGQPCESLVPDGTLFCPTCWKTYIRQRKKAWSRWKRVKAMFGL